MNRSQKIALVIGLVWAGVTAMRPPVLIPAIGVAGEMHPFVVLSQWGAVAAREHGVDFTYLAGELIAIAALISALLYFLKTQPKGKSRRQ